MNCRVLANLFFVIMLALNTKCSKPSVAPKNTGTQNNTGSPNNPTTGTPPSRTPFPYSIARQQTYGGDGTSPSSFLQTKDGGSIVISTATDNGYGFSILRLDAEGNTIWQKMISINAFEFASDIIATNDNAFVISATGGGQGWDALLLKIDQSGTLIKVKTIAGSGDEFGGSLIQSADGSIWMASSTNSEDGDLAGIRSWGKTDAWLVKLSGDLNVVSQKRFGGSGDDAFTASTISSDGNLILASHTQSTDGQVTGSHVVQLGPGQINGDFWICKVDSNGSLIWQKDFGGSLDDWPFAIFQSSNGGVVCSGSTLSSDGDVTGYHNFSDHGVSNVNSDSWTICLNANGTLLWEKCIGGSGNDGVTSICESANNILLTGLTESTDGDVLGNHGMTDTWLVELSTDGELLWQHCFGGTRIENGIKALPLSDGSISILSFTDSNDLDVVGNQSLGGNVWMMKLSH